MAKLLKLRRGSTSQHSSFTGAEGEVTVDTDKDSLVVHDGSTAGGHPVAAEDMANVSAADIKGRLGTTLTNAEINASAAIAGTKISPNFGSQNIVTTGNITAVNITASNDVTAKDMVISDTTPSLSFTDSDNNPDFAITADSGALQFRDQTAGGANRLVINSDGHVDVTGNLDVGAGIDVTGSIEATGNVDINGQIQVGSVDTFLKQNQLRSNAPGAMFFDHGTTGQDINFRTSNSSALDTTGLTIKANGNVDFANGIDVTGAINATSNIATSGNITANNGTVTVSGTSPKITFTETNDNPDYKLEANGGSIAIIDTTNSATRFAVGTSTTNVYNNLDVSSGVDVTGNITVTGTVDGVDIAALNSTVSGITSNATHTGEVTGSTSLTIANNVVDEANLKVSNSPTNGYFLSAQSGNTGGLTWAQVSTDLVADTSPQLGGDLDTNSHHILLDDNHFVKFGDGNDFNMHHNGSNNYINSANGNLHLQQSGADKVIVKGGSLSPANSNIDLGESSLRWQNVYTNDLHLSNEGGANEMDGSWGSWTIQEGESDLFLKNNRSGKKYKFNLTEVS